MIPQPGEIIIDLDMTALRKKRIVAKVVESSTDSFVAASSIHPEHYPHRFFEHDHGRKWLLLENRS